MDNGARYVNIASYKGILFDAVGIIPALAQMAPKMMTINAAPMDLPILCFASQLLTTTRAHRIVSTYSPSETFIY